MSSGATVNVIRSRVVGGVTVKEVVGSPSVRQFVEAVDEIYQDRPTIMVVWDFTHGSPGELRSEDLRRIAGHVRRSAALRANGRTAMIAPGDLAYGMGRVLEVLRELEELPLEFRVFRTATEAAEWLGIEGLMDV
ncbi:MAG: hypothetical protein DWQ36_05825 [Acidobacteria bacterium]|nr:MAG: hypothetical protein DWQ30_08695 [Acidobacteriota bacterium]REK09777.1 MAG: hypothetical protein DWQ36_05825 [Acidobacteriota bacterium]